MSSIENYIDRRKFLRLSSTAAMLGSYSCTVSKPKKIVPYVHQPEYVEPGKSLHFASTINSLGYAKGIVARSEMGRPTKLDGNKFHPGSLGTSDIFIQTTLGDLYDSSRMQCTMYKNRPSTWEEFANSFPTELAKINSKKIIIASHIINSPSAIYLIDKFLKKFPQSEWLSYEAIHDDNMVIALYSKFGKILTPIYKIENAKFIVDFCSDFLGANHRQQNFTSFYAQNKEKIGQSEYWSFETNFSATGGIADKRFGFSQSEIAAAAFALCSELNISLENTSLNEFHLPSHMQKNIKILASKLIKSGQHGIIIIGDHLPISVIEALLKCSEKLGQLNSTISFAPHPNRQAGCSHSNSKRLQELISNGQLDVLIAIDCNPLYEFPNLEEEKFQKIPLSVCYSTYQNETSQHCIWQVPKAHDLEQWLDVLAFDGSLSISQPVIKPLFLGISLLNFLKTVLNYPQKNQVLTDLSHLQNFWNRRLKSRIDFEKKWKKWLIKGVVENYKHSWKSDYFLLNTNQKHNIIKNQILKPTTSNNEIEVFISADETLWDGRFAHNGWLQELPKPISKVVWETPLIISPEFAKKNDLKNNDILKISSEYGFIEGSLFIIPGHAANSVTIYMGGQRRLAGRFAETDGYNAFRLFPAGSFASQKAKWIKRDRKLPLVTTDHHHKIDNSEIAAKTFAYKDFISNQHIGKNAELQPSLNESIYKPYSYKEESWGMVIDLHKCIGCNVCTVACQSENNIPYVGKEEVSRGRELHWIRIDRYFNGTVDSPHCSFQPIPCMHCELAPCEVACPVAATVHSHDGLNQQIYNRCVGTRFCSNNCPYKVRRFNFLSYEDDSDDVRRLMHNPNVSVRVRGVMEKCTYCVQRITKAKIIARRENRPIYDGEVQTACAEACPTHAIQFGNINDKDSKVSNLKKSDRNYDLLASLNTRPRTSYLAKIINFAEESP